MFIKFVGYFILYFLDKNLIKTILANLFRCLELFFLIYFQIQDSLDLILSTIKMIYAFYLNLDTFL